MEVSFYEDDPTRLRRYRLCRHGLYGATDKENGDYLFIKYPQQVEYNYRHLPSIDGANYVKKLRQGYLESLNPDYEDIHLDESKDPNYWGSCLSVYREK